LIGSTAQSSREDLVVDIALTQEQVRQYERDGIVYPIRVMSAAEAQRFRAEYEQLEAYLGRQLEYIPMAHLYFRWAYDLATWPKILDAAEKILGRDVLIEGTLILSKRAHDCSFVKWHQDFHYTAQDSSPTVSAWVALSDSTCRSGCMRVIPGSHHDGVLQHVDTLVPNNILRYSVEVDESPAIDIELRAGEVSLHQADIVHGSLPNQSEDKRIGFIIRFVTPRFKRAINPVVRGRGDEPCEDLNVWTQRPEHNLERNVSAWKQFVQARNLLK
jgi:non-heme Fe2+,alpha-ketoglutarate-dependent halogenase